MAKNDDSTTGRDGVVSIIGPGMRVTGDCETEGTLRIEGSIAGTVRAGKAVVLGKEGVVRGDIITQDAIIGGKVTGTVVAESRLELQATCVIEGEIRARRIKLDEGGVVNGDVRVGESVAQGSGKPAGGQATPAPIQGGQPSEKGGEAPGANG